MDAIAKTDEQLLGGSGRTAGEGEMKILYYLMAPFCIALAFVIAVGVELFYRPKSWNLFCRKGEVSEPLNCPTCSSGNRKQMLNLIYAVRGPQICETCGKMFKVEFIERPSA